MQCKETVLPRSSEVINLSYYKSWCFLECWFRFIHHCFGRIANCVVFVTDCMWNVSHMSTCLILYPQFSGCMKFLDKENRSLNGEYLGISPFSMARCSFVVSWSQQGTAASLLYALNYMMLVLSHMGPTGPMDLCLWNSESTIFSKFFLMIFLHGLFFPKAAEK